MTKLPDDTYRFRREGDRLRFFQQRAEAFMNSSRVEAFSTTVQQIGFVQALGNDTHALSDAGRARPYSGYAGGQPGLLGLRGGL